MYEPTFFDKVMSVNTPVQNRNDNYYEKIFPELTQRESEVLEAVRGIQPCTMHQTAKAMGRELNTISGRFGALVKKKKIRIIGKTQDKPPKSIYEVVK